MADRARKRKKTDSPSRSGASIKRTRQTSAATASNNGPGSGSTLPTSTDWRFRLKVISSPIEVADEVFEEAVQGLVQICFPETILDELGVDVIAAHMEQDNAPAENVQRMRNVSKSVMLSRVAWMLAKYTDTQEKLESAVSLLTDASRVLHGQRLSQETVSGSSSISDIYSAKSSSEASDSSSSEEVPQKTHARKQKKKTRKKLNHKATIQKKTQRNAANEETSDADMAQSSSDKDVATRRVNASVAEEKRVSAKWRWNVDAKDLNADDIVGIFKKTSDLFAYHALPVVQQQLGPTAKRKEVRKKIQSVLADMPDNEYQQWVDSLRNLRNGDLTMLDRVTAEDPGRNISRATPAPTSRHMRVYDDGDTRRQQNSAHARVNGEAVNHIAVGGPSVAVVKQESVADPDQEDVTTNGAFDTSNGVDHDSSTVDHFPAEGVPAFDQSNVEETPIINLLWGPFSIDNSNRGKAVEIMIENLDKRVPAAFIIISLLDGTSKTQGKFVLHRLLNTISAPGSRSAPSYQAALRYKLEEGLEPWVVAHPASFPELVAHSFLFTNPMPHTHSVLQLLLGNNYILEHQIVTKEVLRQLELRGHPNFGLSKLRNQMMIAIMKKGSMVTRQARLEKVLRHVAFARQELFPELKTSILVHFGSKPLV